MMVCILMWNKDSLSDLCTPEWIQGWNMPWPSDSALLSYMRVFWFNKGKWHRHKNAPSEMDWFKFLDRFTLSGAVSPKVKGRETGLQKPYSIHLVAKSTLCWFIMRRSGLISTTSMPLMLLDFMFDIWDEHHLSELP